MFIKYERRAISRLLCTALLSFTKAVYSRHFIAIPSMCTFKLHTSLHVVFIQSLLGPQQPLQYVGLTSGISQVPARSRESQAVWRWIQSQLAISLLEHWSTTESNHAEQVSSSADTIAKANASTAHKPAAPAHMTYSHIMLLIYAYVLHSARAASLLQAPVMIA